MEKEKEVKKGPISDLDVLFSAIAIKMNAFLMNPIAKGGNLGAIFPAVEEIVAEIRAKYESGVNDEAKKATEDKIALTVMALIKDGFIHSNSLTVHLFFGLVDWDSISDDTVEKFADGIYEFATATTLDSENRSDNKYGKMFWYPITELEGLLPGKKATCENLVKLFDYLSSTKSLDGKIKLDEIRDIREEHIHDDARALMEENVKNHIAEYKNMNRLPSFPGVKISCPECGSNEIENAKQKKFFIGPKKPKTFKCKKCGYTW